MSSDETRSAWTRFGHKTSSQQGNLNTRISYLSPNYAREIYDLTVRVRTLHTAAHRESRQVLII